MDDLREQLLQVKKAHTVALRENAQCRTRLRVAERECKRREAEIQRLLSMSWNSSTAPGGGGATPETRVELAALKRKLLLYERTLHEKGQENAKLLADKGVLQASEARKQMEKLENECQRLRTHLAQSVPEAEFLREKDQYLGIINRLVEENMHLRQVIGDFEQRRRDSEKLLAQLGGGDALVRQFRHSSISSRKQANYYKNALGNLMKGQRVSLSGYRNSSMAGSSARNSGLAIKALLEESRRAGRTNRRRRASLDSDTLEELKRMEEAEGKTMEKRGRDIDTGKSHKKPSGEKMKRKKEGGGGGRKEKSRKEEVEEEERNETAGVDEQEEKPVENDSLINGHRPRSASNPGQMLSPRYEEEGEEEDGSDDGQRKEERELVRSGFSSNVSSRMQSRQTGMEEEEEEEEQVEVDGGEEPEDLENHLAALYRLLHAHVLRQQMVKVRQEREPPTVAMHLY